MNRLHYMIKVKVKFALQQAMKNHRGRRGTALLFLWPLRSASAALPPGKRPGTHCTGGLVSPRASLDGCGTSRLHRHSIPGLSSTQPVAIPTELSWPTGNTKWQGVIHSTLLSTDHRHSLRDYPLTNIIIFPGDRNWARYFTPHITFLPACAGGGGKVRKFDSILR